MTMNCAGCDTPLSDPTVAAYAIMRVDEVANKFDAFPVCRECFVNPAHRTFKLDAHFALPAQVDVMLAHAGSSTGIG